MITQNRLTTDCVEDQFYFSMFFGNDRSNSLIGREGCKSQKVLFPIREPFSRSAGVFSTARNSITSPPPSAHDMPLWPAIMAGILKLTNSQEATVRIAGLLNIACMAGSVLFLLSMLTAVPFKCNEKGKALAVAVLLFMPDSIPYSLFHMPDQIALFFVCMALWAYFRGIYQALPWLWFSGVAFALAIYSKPICLPLAGAFFVAAFFIMPCSVSKRFLHIGACVAIIAIMLTPWIIWNKFTFGTAGLTSIAGTNLYGCNWQGMTQSWAEPKKTEARECDVKFASTLVGIDPMLRSKKMGSYAQQKILHHFPEYILYSLKEHPRLYCGTGTVALMRYVGMTSASAAINKDIGTDRGTDPIPQKREKIFAWSVQIVSFAIMGGFYLIMFIGFVAGMKNAIIVWKQKRCFLPIEVVPFVCAFCGILLLAIVIGPVTATRYRFIMLPFFAMLASFAISSILFLKSSKRLSD